MTPVVLSGMDTRGRFIINKWETPINRKARWALHGAQMLGSATNEPDLQE
jgi:hypothetical protein